VLYTFERGFATGGVDNFFNYVMNVSSINNITIVDDYTFTLRTYKPNPMPLSIMTNHHKSWHDSTQLKAHATAADPWSLEYTKRNGSGGFGAYVPTEWVAGDRIVLTANPNFHDGKPAIDTIILKVIPESSTRVATLKDGTIDVAYALSPSELKSLEGVKGVRVIAMDNTEGVWVWTNNKYPPFDNKLVRQALNWATPRQEICDVAFLGYAHPWTAVFPMLYEASTGPEDFPYGYDLNKARALLTQAGYANGFTVELAYPAGNPAWETMATLVKTSYGKIGVNVQLKKMPAGAYSTQLNAKEMPFGLWSSTPMNPDPNYSLTLMYYGPSFANWENYSNPEVDALIEQGTSIIDWDQRVAFHETIQKMIMDDAALVWAIEADYTIAIRDNVKGWNWNTVNETLFEKLYFAQ
jgi:peptide/nickel transport system substrate-binding protein